MSHDYQRALDATRRFVEGHAEPELRVASLRAATEVALTQRRRLRIVVVAVAAAVVVAWLTSIFAHPVGAGVCEWVTRAAIVRYGIVHVVGFVIAAAVASRPDPWAQMLARALWWSSLLIGSAGLVLEPGILPLLMPTIALGAATCLWRAGGLDLERLGPATGFGIAAHRGSITLMMILAMADTQTLVTGALNHETPLETPFMLVDLACATAMGLAMWGLYRLRGWGLVLALVLNGVIAALGFGGLLFYAPAFGVLLGATALVQIGLALPLLRTLGRGRVPETRPPRVWGPRWSSWALAALLAFDGWAFVRMNDAQVVAEYCAAD